MLKENYLLHIDGTIKAYSTKIQKHIIDIFFKEGIAKDINGQIPLDLGGDIVDVSNKTLDQQIISCLHESNQALSLFENWEFIKDYKYSAIFETSNFDDFIKKLEDIPTISEKDESNYIFDTIYKPVKFCDDNRIFLKFNINFSANHPQTLDEILAKYPFLVVIHIQEKLIEFRFDVIKSIFINKPGDQIYCEMIQQMIQYILVNYKTKLTPLDLLYMIQVAKEADDVILIAEYLKLPTGGNAQLEVGNNEKYMLPFIGELKAFMVDYQDEFEKSPVLKEALEQFMFEKEELSDYPWIQLMWDNEVKTRSISIKLTFNYLNNDFCLIQHYYNSLVGMERMNHVVKYISSHRDID